MLGKIQPALFPQVFGPGADPPLDREVVRARLRAMAADVTARHGRARSRAEERRRAASLRIAVANMANAIKRISVARGYDVTQYTLQCFGGAGGQHACAVADALGMRSVFLASAARACSRPTAWAWLDQPALRERAVERRLDAAGLRARGAASAPSAASARRPRNCASRASPEAAIAVLHRASTCATRAPTPRCPASLPMATPAAEAIAAMRDAFEQAYRRRFAFLMSKRAR